MQHVKDFFGCCSEKDPRYFGTECKNCPLNGYLFDLFARNSFYSANCGCVNTNKKNYCSYCYRLQDHLNYSPKKACVEIGDLKNLPIKVIDFNKYLWDIKVDPFLFLMSSLILSRYQLTM